MIIDCVIIGGGVAGLSAALVLGRSCRRVAICDAGHPRNAASEGVHCFPGREAVAPAELLRICRQELGRYADISLVSGTVQDAAVVQNGFSVTMNGMPFLRARSLILATGVIDELPDVPGVEKFFGRSVHVCPYCDGWERRDQPLSVVGDTRGAGELARELRAWSRYVTLCTNVDTEPGEDARSMLARAGVSLAVGRITALEGEAPQLQAIRLADGKRVECKALFFRPAQAPRSPLAQRLGCRLTSEGESVKCGKDNETSIRGVFAAGNIRGGLELAMVAAADGIRAGVAVNEYLLDLDYPTMTDRA